MTDPIDRLAEQAVADIDYHWGSAYVIWHTAGPVFHALPKTGGDVAELTAATAQDLRLLIRADYDRRTAT